MPRLGYRQSAAHRAARSASLQGRKVTPATRDKMRLAARARANALTSADRKALTERLQRMVTLQNALDPAMRYRRNYQVDRARLSHNMKISTENRCLSGRPRMRIDRDVERWAQVVAGFVPELEGCWNAEQLVPFVRTYVRQLNAAGLRQQWAIYARARHDLHRATDLLAYRLVQLTRTRPEMEAWQRRQRYLTLARFDLFLQRFGIWEIVPCDQYVPDDSLPTPADAPMRVVHTADAQPWWIS